MLESEKRKQKYFQQNQQNFLKNHQKDNYHLSKNWKVYLNIQIFTRSKSIHGYGNALAK